MFASRRSALCRTEQQTLILAVTTKKGVIHCKKNKKKTTKHTHTNTAAQKYTHAQSFKCMSAHARTHVPKPTPLT